MRHERILRRCAELVLLAILIVAIALVWSAGAHAYPAASDTQWKPWAQKWHRIAVKERRILVRHTDALGLPKPRKVPTVREWTVTLNDPSTGVEIETMSWRHYGADSKRVAKAYRARRVALHERIVHPGGSSTGARWKPAARLAGWPEYALPHLVRIIDRESSGRTGAVSSANCRGLTQLHYGWYSGAWAIRGKHRAFDPHDPLANLKAALGIWRDQGRSFDPAWRLTL